MSRRHLTKIVFLDKPKDYRGRLRSASSMVDAPERLRVALHREALGVYEFLSEDEPPLHAGLWREVEYRRVSHTLGMVAKYTCAEEPGGGVVAREMSPLPAGKPAARSSSSPRDGGKPGPSEPNTP